jgi:hypothetical protein
MITQNKRLYGILFTAMLLLLIPLIAMQFTNEVDWTLVDFLVMGVLLIGTGLMCELVLRNVKKIEHRVLLIAAILFGFFLVWAQLAVGLLSKFFSGELP